MYSIDLEVLNLDQAEHRYFSEFPIRDARDNGLGDALAVSSYASVTLRHDIGCVQQREIVLFFLHESLLPEVPALARSHLFIYNDHLPDLMENHTYVEFRGEHVRVRVPADALGGFFDIGDSAVGVVGVHSY